MIFLIIHQSRNTFHQILQIRTFGSFIGSSIDNGSISLHLYLFQFSRDCHFTDLYIIILQCDHTNIHRQRITQYTVYGLHSHEGDFQ